jgi:hypothetical protein
VASPLAASVATNASDRVDRLVEEACAFPAACLHFPTTLGAASAAWEDALAVVLDAAGAANAAAGAMSSHFQPWDCSCPGDRATQTEAFPVLRDGTIDSVACLRFGEDGRTVRSWDAGDRQASLLEKDSLACGQEAWNPSALVDRLRVGLAAGARSRQTAPSFLPNSTPVGAGDAYADDSR